LLVRFGGHAQACGITLNRAQLEPFRAMINQHAQRLLGCEGLVKTRFIDLELPLSALSRRWVDETSWFAPFGPGNERPSVIIRELAVELSSPRRAILTQDTTRVAAKGRLPTSNLGGRYDVVAHPNVVDGELVLTVSDARVSALS
jgi:single-stranded DNA-specific DHH superfamily exonuclease